MSSGFGLEKVPTTEGWIWLVFGSCIANFIIIPIFLFILIQIIHSMSSNKTQPFQDKAIWISSIGYLLCLFVISITQFTIFQPYRWGIQASSNICTFVKRPEIVFNALSHYFFYQFCLFRIHNTFHKSQRLKMPPWQFIGLQILIHGYLIYHAIIFQLLIKMRPHPIFGFCYAYNEDSDIYVGIALLMDFIIVFILIWMFCSKLICGLRKDASDESQALTWFKTKTLVLGLASTLSSLMVSIMFVLGRLNRFMYVLDGLFNAWCIVFTYNMRHTSFPSICECNRCCFCGLQSDPCKKSNNIQKNEIAKEETYKLANGSIKDENEEKTERDTLV